MAGEKNKGPSLYLGRFQLWEEIQHAYFQGYQKDRGPIGSLKCHCWKVRKQETRHFRGVLARDTRGLLKVGKESIGSQ